MQLQSGLFLRKAKNKYTCYAFKFKDSSKEILKEASKNCLEVILPNDSYVECYWESPIYGSGDRYCLECSKTHLGLANIETLIDVQYAALPIAVDEANKIGAKVIIRKLKNYNEFFITRNPNRALRKNEVYHGGS